MRGVTNHYILVAEEPFLLLVFLFEDPALALKS